MWLCQKDISDMCSICRLPFENTGKFLHAREVPYISGIWGLWNWQKKCEVTRIGLTHKGRWVQMLQIVLELKSCIILWRGLFLVNDFNGVRIASFFNRLVRFSFQMLHDSICCDCDAAECWSVIACVLFSVVSVLLHVSIAAAAGEPAEAVDAASISLHWWPCWSYDTAVVCAVQEQRRAAQHVRVARLEGRPRPRYLPRSLLLCVPVLRRHGQRRPHGQVLSCSTCRGLGREVTQDGTW